MQIATRPSRIHRSPSAETGALGRRQASGSTPHRGGALQRGDALTADGRARPISSPDVVTPARRAGPRPEETDDGA